MKSKLLIFGFGGHARSVADVALMCGYRELLFIDENARAGEDFLGFRVVSPQTCPSGRDWLAFPAAGDNLRRSLQCVSIAQMGLELVSLISPTATLGVRSEVAPGCFVGHHSHLGPMAKLGAACILNTGAIVEHESTVGDYSHISVNATVAGRSHVGSYCMVGAGACVIDGKSVADHVVLGAGAMVNRSVTKPGTYVGIPARLIR